MLQGRDICYSKIELMKCSQYGDISNVPELAKSIKAKVCTPTILRTLLDKFTLPLTTKFPRPTS